jgi:hypothetical protein
MTGDELAWVNSAPWVMSAIAVAVLAAAICTMFGMAGESWITSWHAGKRDVIEAETERLEAAIKLEDAKRRRILAEQDAKDREWDRRLKAAPHKEPVESKV